jgi:hypothetical protein
LRKENKMRSKLIKEKELLSRKIESRRQTTISIVQSHKGIFMSTQ